ncbi:hypothetical protein B0H11DRAFT_2223502 [Mycena galericulata]|nr:hypothetical protein B0H11DRAFT_2223502 [Mycena galericulata]
MYPDNVANRGGYASSGSRGRGIGSPSRGYESPRGRGRGRGDESPRDWGRGRGRGGPRLRPDAPLSKLLYEERPFLRPIKFVPAVHHATLFQEEEELFQPLVEDVGDEEQSHVPTADRVSRVFSGGDIPRMESENDQEEELEEIDFEDLAKLREEVDATAAIAAAVPVPVEIVEERFTGIFINNKSLTTTVDSPMPDAPTEADSAGAEPVGVVNLTVSGAQVPSDAVKSVVIDLGKSPPSEIFYVDTTAISQSVAGAPGSTPILSDTSSPGANITSVPSDAESAVPQIVHPVGESVQTAASPAPPPSDLFYIDTTPTPVMPAPGGVESALAPLNAYPSPTYPDDEVIVYVAPHPRAGRILSPSPPPAPVVVPSLSTTSILTGTTLVRPTTPPPAPPFASVSAFGFTPSPKKIVRKQAPVFTVQAHAKARTKARALARRVERRGRPAFGAFGAQVAEAQLRGRDPRRDEQRRGDSDVDWGDEDNGPEEEEVANGMDVDVEFHGAAMRRFAMGMSAEGGQFVTMDDIEDELRMREEDAGREVARSSGEDDDNDEDGEDSSGEDEVDAIVDAEEGVMVAEPRDLPSDDGDESDEDEDSDANQSPKTGFQARLERLRKAARERGPDDSLELMEGEDSSDDDFFLSERTWAERDDDFAAEVQAFLDDNGDIIAAHSRQGRKKLLKAVANGELINFDEFSPAKRGKNKRNSLPAELQAVWDKDRAKKAENKRLRALARLEAAADPLSHHKGGKKGRKAMLTAARVDPTITVIPNRVVDMATLVQQIRRFIADIGGPATMSLPPTDKATRKNIHEMAVAFNLKSVSKGKGDARYTTLSKTTRSGFDVNEAKVSKIARRGGSGRGGAAFVGDKGKGRAVTVPRHRDGDEVGKAAPKIGESNIGFKMLASMGWAEGDRIGVSAGGLHVPLTAVIKNTKLGLGATR